jgi:hypothetical protein
MEVRLTEENIKFFNNSTRESIIKQCIDDISDLTSEPNIIFLSKIQNLLTLRPEAEEKLSNFFNELEFDKFTLTFKSESYANKFQCFLLQLNNPNFFFYVLSIPQFLIISLWCWRLNMDIKTGKTSNEFPLVLIFIGALDCLSISFYTICLKRWHSSYNTQTYMHLDASITINPDDPSSVHLNYVKKAVQLGKLGSLTAIITGVFKCLYIIYRIKSGICYTGCIDGIPLISLVAGIYLPFHYSIIMCINWKTTLIIQLIMLVGLIISYYLKYKSLNGRIPDYLHTAGLWLLFTLSLYMIQYSRINSFKNREILMRFVSERQKEDLIELANIWV